MVVEGAGPEEGAEGAAAPNEAVAEPVASGNSWGTGGAASAGAATMVQ
eukprot:COSAG01_NODE_22495_length_853_cov_1.159151_1_plen_47_part_01